MCRWPQFTGPGVNDKHTLFPFLTRNHEDKLPGIHMVAQKKCTLNLVCNLSLDEDGSKRILSARRQAVYIFENLTQAHNFPVLRQSIYPGATC